MLFSAPEGSTDRTLPRRLLHSVSLEGRLVLKCANNIPVRDHESKRALAPFAYARRVTIDVSAHRAALVNGALIALQRNT
jgi:hypothetical protein